MGAITIRSRVASAVLAGLVFAGAGGSQPSENRTSPYTAASSVFEGGLDQAWLNVFPIAGEGRKLPLRPGLAGGFYYLGSSTDGRVLYGVTPADQFGGLKELQISPVHESVVAGSTGLGNITSLIVTSAPVRILVSASLRKLGRSDCGDFEIDPAAGVLRPLRLGVSPDCGGPLSPDGKRELHSSGEQLSILDLSTGKSTPIGQGMKRPSWSPDGRWIAVVEGKNGVLMDAADPSKKRRLAPADGRMIWSPDSKYLLLQRSQISCLASLYGVSLETVNVETGKRTLIKSSHCNVLSGGFFFWIASDLIR
jgi:dipeptidyl aminopeptidase/acylaminoacyl peptidase